MTQWISVDEDVPDVGQQVIVARENGHVTMASYEAARTIRGMTYRWIEYEWIISDVTHWQPLPDHPEVLEEERRSKAGTWHGGSTLEDFGYLNPDEYYD